MISTLIIYHYDHFYYPVPYERLLLGEGTLNTFIFRYKQLSET